MSILPDADWKEMLAWICRRRRRIRIVGRSMVPLLQPGNEVLVNPRAYHRRSPQPGDLVLAEHPHRPGFRLVKRLVTVWESGDCILMGENIAESTDSRSFGAVPRHCILGQITSRF